MLSISKGQVQGSFPCHCLAHGGLAGASSLEQIENTPPVGSVRPPFTAVFEHPASKVSSGLQTFRILKQAADSAGAVEMLHTQRKVLRLSWLWIASVLLDALSLEWGGVNASLNDLPS